MTSRRVFLSGMMGSGKSAVGRALASAWGCDFVDLDGRIEATAGMSIPEIFDTRGESGFRALESRVLASLLDGDTQGVVALGGGAVCDRANRRRMLDEGTLVTLVADPAELARRVSLDDGRPRPLLTGAGQDGEALRDWLASVIESRRGDYAECHHVTHTDGLEPGEVARQLDEVIGDAPVAVPLGERSYRVEIGPGVRHRLVERMLPQLARKQVVLVTDEGVREPWAEAAAGALRDGGIEVVMVCLPQGEAHKTIGSVERIWDAALQAGIDRGSGLLAVGGGVVGDMGAFAASTLLRGIVFAQIPTTLLSMVDSAVGGKTGFDRPEGKNLVGTFYQPRFVLCDMEMLSTLPLAERRAGLAEVVKSAWLDGEDSVAMLERRGESLVAGALDATEEAVRMSVRLKARVVTRDERESGVRALLNLGHTVGHAIEAAAGYQGLRHGEAVSLGCVAAFRVSRALGHGTGAQALRMERLLAGFGLPVDLASHLDEHSLDFLSSDKKRRGNQLGFVLPGAPGDTRLQSIDMSRLRAILLGDQPAD